MSGTTDKMKGRIKQTIGSLTDDAKLRRNGRADERAGRVKQKAGRAIDVVRDKLEEAADTLSSSEKEE